MTERERAGLAVGAAIFLGLATATTAQWVGVALLAPALVLAALAALRRRTIPALGSINFERGYVVAFWIGLALFFVSLLRALDVGEPIQLLLLIVGSCAVGGSGFALMVQRKGSLACFVFLGAYLVVSLGVLKATVETHPYIDVVMFQQDASQALPDGLNPYELRFPDQYTEAESAVAYGPGVSEDGVLQFGYPYLPLSLLLVAPFELIFGDFRIAHVIALVATAYVMTRIRPGRGGRSIAVLFLLTSPAIYVSVFGWIEPLLVLGSALIVLAASRSSGAVSFLTGALLSLKQYGILLLPVSALLFERPFTVRELTRHLLRAFSVVAITVAPFFLWNPGEFTWSVVELQFVQPFRYDSLSFMAAWATAFGEPAGAVTSMIPILLVIGVSIAALRRTPTGSQGFALAAGVTLLAAFAFSKQAFPNYYILVIGLLFLGAAAGQAEDPGTATGSGSAAVAPAESTRPAKVRDG